MRSHPAHLLRPMLSATAAVLLALPGCSGPKTQPVQEAKPLPVDLRLEAGPRINPDPRGNPLSVVVRTYQLKVLDEFSKLTFDRASSDRPAAELLGQEVVSTSEFTVVPGATAIRTESLKPEAQYLAIVALFRQPDPQFWRVVIAAKDLRPAPVQESKGFFSRKSETPAPAKGKSATIKVQENAIALEGLAYVALPGQPTSR